MITSADQRLGRHGADEIKAHPFFAGVDWNSLRSIDAPFKPKLQSITDTSYFPTDELENVPDAPAVAAMMAQQNNNDAPLPGEEAGLPFIGYTYKRLYVLPETKVGEADNANMWTVTPLRVQGDFRREADILYHPSSTIYICCYRYCSLFGSHMKSFLLRTLIEDSIAVLLHLAAPVGTCLNVL